RYPRDAAPGSGASWQSEPLPLGKAELRRKGRDVALLAFGALLAPTLEAARALNATVVNMRFVKPLDLDLILNLVPSHRLFVTVEENAIAGGAGSAVSELLSEAGILVPFLHLGLPDRFLDQATRQEQLADCGLDPPGIEAAVRNAVDDFGLGVSVSKRGAGS
ncbi:MAG: transketolase C-terminal domain-containing protein, partial [Anaerolineae bacterium]